MNTVYEFPTINYKCEKCEARDTIFVKISMFKTGQKHTCTECGRVVKIKPVR